MKGEDVRLGQRVRVVVEGMVCGVATSKPDGTAPTRCFVFVPTPDEPWDLHMGRGGRTFWARVEEIEPSNDHPES